MIPKHLLINFDELNVGQRVWTIQQGYTKIKILDINYPYPIITENERGKEKAYSSDGKDLTTDKFPSMFLDCPFIEEERVVEVSNNEKSWKKRILIAKTNGVFVTHYVAESIEKIDVKHNDVFPRWNFMRELQPEPIKEEDPKIIEVSMDDVASMLSKLLGSDVRVVKK